MTLPAWVRDEAELQAGDVLRVTVVGREITLSPDVQGMVVPDDLHARLQRALVEVEAGDTTTYLSDEEFLASFDEEAT
jgi:bifunctional DNA-binding transcriptional regulator/antitoxin component of YhaV-PrlF toxin-antitoxin module